MGQHSNKRKEVLVPVHDSNENYLYVPTQTEQTRIILNFHSPGLSPQEEASLVVIGNYLGFGVKSFYLKIKTCNRISLYSKHFQCQIYGRWNFSNTNSFF